MMFDILSNSEIAARVRFHSAAVHNLSLDLINALHPDVMSLSEVNASLNAINTHIVGIQALTNVFASRNPLDD